MAIYSCSVKTVGRSGGRSATAAAAYRNAEQIVDERTGVVHDYERRSGVDDVIAFGPEGMEPQTSAQLWNAAEQAETRSNATVAREVLVALPHELEQDQRRELTERISGRLADRYGVAGTAAIHQPDAEGDNRNHHAHILMTTRRMDPATGQLGEKTRELDAKATGQGEVKWIRAMVAGETNAALARAGLDERVDHRSLKEQQAAALEAGDQQAANRLDRLPTVHEGPTVTAIRRRGGQSQVAQINDARRQANEVRDEHRTELQHLDAQIFDLEQARAARAKAEAEEQKQAEAARERRERAVELAREVRQLDELARQPEPRVVATAKAEVLRAKTAQQDAAQWHREHPIRSRLCRAVGITPEADRRAQEAVTAAERSPARHEALAWRAEARERAERLQEARSELERVPEVQEWRQQVREAGKRLQEAERTMLDDVHRSETNQRMGRWQHARDLLRELEQQYRTPDPDQLPELLANANSVSQHEEKRRDQVQGQKAEQQRLQAEQRQQARQEQAERPSSPSRGPRLG